MPVKPVTKEQMKQELEGKFEECFDEATVPTCGGYGADYTFKWGFYKLFEPHIDNYVSLQTAEAVRPLEKRIAELEAGLQEIEDCQDKWEGIPITPIEMCTKAYTIATLLLNRPDGV